MAAKRKSWLGEWWRSLAALLLWAVGVVAAHAAPPLLPSLAETRVGGLQPSAEIIAPADLFLSLELHRACGPPLYDLASDCSVAAKSGATKDVFTHGYKYDARVAGRAAEDPVSHNFPYRFDDTVLSTTPVSKPNGYNMFRQPGTMNGKEGVFEIGVTKDGVIDHRFFRPNK